MICFVYFLSRKGSEIIIHDAAWINNLILKILRPEYSIAVDALASCDVRSSATMILIMNDKQVSVLHEEGYRLPVAVKLSRNYRNAEMFYASSYDIIK